MILVGNSRGGARDLAQHLMNDRDNDHVTVHQLKGFVADDLDGAFQEAYAVSRGTKCRQFLFSLSLNPPAYANVSTDDFVAAIDKVERQLGLEGQPRAIVFHEKEEGPHGPRRHAHAVWSRINAQTMTARQMSFHKMKLQSVSRELYREHGWRMPEGLADRSKSDPRNYTLAEWQQAKRVGKDAREIKEAFQDAWAISDNRASFEHALKERGYWLARGDRRGFVAIDHHGEVYSVSRQAAIKTKAVRERLGEEDTLPSLSQAEQTMVQEMSTMLSRLRDEQYERAAALKAQHNQHKQTVVDQQRRERAAFLERLQERQRREQAMRQARFRKGLTGLWDRLRGEHKRLAERNRLEAITSRERDKAQRDILIFRQLSERQLLNEQSKRKLEQVKERKRELVQDTERIAEIAQGRDSPSSKGKRQRGRKPPEHTPPRSRSQMGQDFQRSADKEVLKDKQWGQRNENRTRNSPSSPER